MTNDIFLLLPPPGLQGVSGSYLITMHARDVSDSALCLAPSTGSFISVVNCLEFTTNQSKHDLIPRGLALVKHTRSSYTSSVDRGWAWPDIHVFTSVLREEQTTRCN